MSYDALAESLRLLDGAPPSEHARLSRRVRHLPLAVDRDGDVAVTLFLRRGVSGSALMDCHVLDRSGGTWRLLGGGGGPGQEATGPRLRTVELGAPLSSSGGGGVSRSWGWGWVSYAEVLAAAEVRTLRVGPRLLAVAGHGVAAVVWTGRPPVVTALDAAGAVLGELQLSG